MTQREITTNGWTVDDHRRAEQIRTDRGMARMVILDEVDTYDAEALSQAYQTMFAPRVTTTREAGLTVTHFTRAGFTQPQDEEAP